MKRYIKDGQIKFRNEIVLHGTRTIKGKDGKEKEVKTQIINPKEEMILADGWVEYVAPSVESIVENEEEYSSLDNTIEYCVPEVSDKAAFVRARHKLRNAIQSYDTSKEVNCFYMQDEPMWLDFENRSRLLLRFQAETAKGNETTTLWSNGKEYALPLSVAINMLYELETYASKCYDNTQRHLANIASLQLIEDIQSYDYKIGYPEKLCF